MFHAKACVVLGKVNEIWALLKDVVLHRHSHLFKVQSKEGEMSVVTLAHCRSDRKSARSTSSPNERSLWGFISSDVAYKREDETNSFAW